MIDANSRSLHQIWHVWFIIMRINMSVPDLPIGASGVFLGYTLARHVIRFGTPVLICALLGYCNVQGLRVINTKHNYI